MNDTYLFNKDKTAYIRIYSNALEHMVEYKQTGWLSREAGGELFTSQDVLGNSVHIDVACGPTRRDKRKRSSFKQDVDCATNTRWRMYEKGYTPVGLWHTHPERNPTPSGLDETTVRKYFRSLKPTVGQKYVMLILGNDKNKHLFYAKVFCVNKGLKFTCETFFL